MRHHIKPNGRGGWECRSLGIVGHGRAWQDAYKDWLFLSLKHVAWVEAQLLAWRGRTA